jgi:hypothetical protein
VSLLQGSFSLIVEVWRNRTDDVAKLTKHEIPENGEFINIAHNLLRSPKVSYHYFIVIIIITLATYSPNGHAPA